MEREFGISLGKRLRAVRVDLGLTQEEAAELAGLSVQAVSSAEAARKLPTLETLTALARGLRVPMANLFEDAAAPLTARDRADARVRVAFRGMGRREIARLAELALRFRDLTDAEARAATKLAETVRGLPARDVQLLLAIAAKIKGGSTERRKRGKRRG